MRLRALIGFLLCLAALTPAMADDRLVRLSAPAQLVDSGVLNYALPRFSLKTQVRVEMVVPGADADLQLGDSGQAVFAGAGRVWKMDVINPDHAGTAKLANWLKSETGLRTIVSFAPEGTSVFAPPPETVRETAVVAMDGDAALGHAVSRAKCTRCHAVDDATRGWGIGSTPSFGVLRSLPDWQQRFAVFYVLNPHPAFTQITDVTDPFPTDRPSPISPIQLDVDELDALLAYVAAMPAADLGKPLDHQ